MSALATGDRSAPLPASFAGGRYKVLSLIGEGDSKVVYLAHDMKLLRDVAFSLLKVENLDDASKARVRREARALGRLGDHPNIVTVHDVGTVRGQPYVVSQYMTGGSLETRQKKAENRRFPISEVLRIGDQVCAALEHAHSHGVVHRDLKPANILFTPDGTAKVADLGFGLILATELSRQIGSSMPVDTVAYTAPEQALAKQFDARSDLYSLGAILYEMATGRPPFLGDDLASVVNQHLKQPPMPPSWRMPEIPKDLEVLILKLLAKSPDERPKTASLVREGLQAIAAEMDSSANTEAAALLQPQPVRTQHTVAFHEAPTAPSAPLQGAATRASPPIHRGHQTIRPPRSAPPEDHRRRAQTILLNEPLKGGIRRHPFAVGFGSAALLAIGLGLLQMRYASLARRAARGARIVAMNSAPGSGAPASAARTRGQAPDPKLVAAAETGDVAAQRKLGLVYLTGRGAATDYEKALNWLHKAADQNDGDAKVILGGMYAKGEGVTRDYAEALQWFYQAASQGNREGEYNLGRLYLRGEGVAQDYAVALEWLRKAAALENPQAEYALAKLSMRGEAVPQDFGEAREWLRKAASHGSSDAQFELGKMYLIGQGVNPDYVLATQWFLKAANNGNAQAQNALGYIYQQAQGVSQNYEEALKWYRMAAAQGYAKAELNLGLMYQNGEGVPQSYSAAVRWFREAALQGDAVAQTNLGFMYWKGHGVSKDYAQALQWFRKAAANGNPQAQYAMGEMYDNGRGVPKDYAKAAQWYRKAAEHGNRDAQYNLGYMYEYGQGVGQDLAEAVQWYRKAADQGDADAMQKLRDFVIGTTSPTTASRY